MKKKRLGLGVHVLRPADGSDCTLDGVSSKHARFILTGLGTNSEIFESDADAPELRLVKKVYSFGTYYHAAPVREDGQIGTFGGNYIDTSDGRFKAVCGYPIPIHDRFESREALVPAHALSGQPYTAPTPSTIFGSDCRSGLPSLPSSTAKQLPLCLPARLSLALS